MQAHGRLAGDGVLDQGGDLQAGGDGAAAVPAGDIAALTLHVGHRAGGEAGVEAEQLVELAVHAVGGVGVAEQRQADRGVEVQVPRVAGRAAAPVGVEQRGGLDVGVAVHGRTSPRAERAPVGPPG